MELGALPIESFFSRRAGLDQAKPLVSETSSQQKKHDPPCSRIPGVVIIVGVGSDLQCYDLCEIVNTTKHIQVLLIISNNLF